MEDIYLVDEIWEDNMVCEWIGSKALERVEDM
jgi:hypothetical protein